MFSNRTYTAEDLFELVSKGSVEEVHNIIEKMGVYSSAEDPKKEGKFKAVDFVNKDGETALHIAAKKGHFVVAQLLVAKGAVVDKQNCDGDTPLITAINSSLDVISPGHADVIAFLKEIGADINCLKRGTAFHLTTSTALSRAAAHGDLRKMERLIAAGADVNREICFKGREDFSDILSATLSWSKFDAALLLIKHGANITGDNVKKFMAAIIEHKKEDLLQAAIEVSLDVNQSFSIRRSNGLREEATLLSLAVDLGESGFDAALLLIRYGAKITESNVEKFLAAIIEHNRVDLLHAAIEAGLDVNQSFNIRHSYSPDEEKTLFQLVEEAIIGCANEHEEETLRVDAIRVLIRAGSSFPFIDGATVDPEIASLFLTESTETVEPGEPKPLVRSVDAREGTYQRREAALRWWKEKHESASAPPTPPA